MSHPWRLELEPLGSIRGTAALFSDEGLDSFSCEGFSDCTYVADSEQPGQGRLIQHSIHGRGVGAMLLAEALHKWRSGGDCRAVTLHDRRRPGILHKTSCARMYFSSALPVVGSGRSR
jgi:hypothetical protein